MLRAIELGARAGLLFSLIAAQALAQPSASSSPSAPAACERTTTAEPPFMISKVTANTSEGFSAGNPHGIVSEPWLGPKSQPSPGVTPAPRPTISSGPWDISQEVFSRSAAGGRWKWLPRGSLVKASVSAEQVRKLASDKHAFVPVEVLATRGLYAQYKSAAEKNAQVAKGEKGYVPAESLTPAGSGQVYRVLKNSPLLKRPEGAALSSESALRLRAHRDASGSEIYEVMKCCAGANSGPSPSPGTSCATRYLFDVLDGLKTSGETALEIGSCDLSGLQPIDPASLEGLSRLQRALASHFNRAVSLNAFEMNDWGEVKLPFDPIKRSAVGDISGVGPERSFVHYQGSDPEGSDTWGKPQNVCSVLRLTQEWKKKCMAAPGADETRCTPQVGDLSFITPGRMGDGTDPVGHKSHFAGECVDIRPLRKDKTFGGLTWQQSGVYDRERSIEFLKLARELGAGPIYFNDPQAIATKNPDGTPLTGHAEGHDNHFHICFQASNPRAAANCEQ